ncbi:hypothetical protein HPB52_017988 [Rhipicephalus sanguineus]|uniref:Uncharacterized protein n=1 Tax=Rhipicephalus sanguineus TaxID=34632 RepID=A0A9D4PER5_RHISA|nr:hypothetical protein HPB52_017988 [Rhipicephalus sanguineus]
MSGGGGLTSTTAVFGGQLWCARTTSEGRWLVRSFRADGQQGDACEAVPCGDDLVVTAPGAGHSRRDCELTRVPCWSNGLETLVLRAGDSVHVWDDESAAFQRAAEDVAAGASQCAVFDGPTLVLLSPGRLRLEPLPQTGSGPVVVTLDEQEPVQGILSGTSCQVAISEVSCEPSWILLCVLALREGAYFVAASGTRTTRLPASLFLGSLYESSSLMACLVTLPSGHGEAPVAPWDQLKTVFGGNVTVACTASGSVLVIESGCPRLDYVLVSFGSGGGAVISQDASGRFRLGECIEPGLEICCGDLLGLGSEQVVAWEPASSHIRCLQPSRFVGQHEGGDEEAAAAGSQASQVLVNLLQYYSGASQAALEKLRRAREQAEALLHETTQQSSAADNNPTGNAALLPVLPMEQQPMEQVEQAAQVPEKAKLLDSWAHVWGRRLLLGFRFSWPSGLTLQQAFLEPLCRHTNQESPTVLVASPGVTFGVKTSLEEDALVVGASCGLPGSTAGPMTVCILGGSTLRHQCVIDVHRLPWCKQGQVPPRLALWSLTAAQPSRHFSASTSVTWRLSSLDGLTRLYNTLYVCCDGASPLFQANVELLPEGGLCLRAQDEEQLSLFEQWLWRQLPGAKEGMTRVCSSTVQTRLATLLRSEVQGVRALLHEPYVEARRSLQSTEGQTDFLAQLVTDTT